MVGWGQLHPEDKPNGNLNNQDKLKKVTSSLIEVATYLFEDAVKVRHRTRIGDIIKELREVERKLQ